MGTVAYMSPEQTTGAAVDARTDLWSLGVVLYEMVAGRLPFAGDHPFAIGTAIVNATPAPLTSLKAGLPSDLDRLIDQALAKRPENRFPTAADLLSDLRRVQRDVQPGTAGHARIPRATAFVRWRGARGALVTGVAVILAAAAYAMLSSLDDGDAPLRLANPVQIAASIAVEGNPPWSPDGRMIAYDANYAGRSDVWLVQANGGAPINRTAERSGIASRPQWSPDGRQIMFFGDQGNDGGGTFVIPALAGTARLVCDFLPGFDDVGVWSPEGSELGCFKSGADGIDLELRNVQSGAIRHLKLPGEHGNVRLDFRWSPDGQFLAYVDSRNHTAQVARIWMLRLRDGHAAPLTSGRMNDWSPTWGPDSRTLYYVSNRGGPMDLWRQRIDESGGPRGDADRVTTGMELASVAVGCRCGRHRRRFRDHRATSPSTSPALDRS